MTKESEGVTNHSTPLQSEQTNQLHLTNQITLIKFLRKKLWAGKSGMQQIHVVKLNTEKKDFCFCLHLAMYFLCAFTLYNNYFMV